MKQSDRYRSHAAECVRLAQQSDSAADKALLLEMANQWIELADQMNNTMDSDGGEETN